MGLVSLPGYGCYLSIALRFPAIADVVSCNRFFEFNKYLHFYDKGKIVTEDECKLRQGLQSKTMSYHAFGSMPERGARENEYK